ncbi:hypothetical protein [Paenibacillus sp. MBLB4367]|uniref:hypothetical protein n=1 Tax=Paenibacillus sp. MBLB4367 TaxID=3384767 RepID=UPI003907F5EA
MRPLRLLFAAAIVSLFVLSACSQQQKPTVREAFESEGIRLTETETPAETELNGVKPDSFKLDNEETVRVYTFDTKANRKLAAERLRERQRLLSSFPPLLYEAEQILVLYYGQTDSGSVPMKQDDTAFGVKIRKAVERLE